MPNDNGGDPRAAMLATAPSHGAAVGNSPVTSGNAHHPGIALETPAFAPARQLLIDEGLRLTSLGAGGALRRAAATSTAPVQGRADGRHVPAAASVAPPAGATVPALHTATARTQIENPHPCH